MAQNLLGVVRTEAFSSKPLMNQSVIVDVALRRDFAKKIETLRSIIFHRVSRHRDVVIAPTCHRVKRVGHRGIGFSGPVEQVMPFIHHAHIEVPSVMRHRLFHGRVALRFGRFF